MWRWTSLEIIGKDLRYAMRTLRANPLFTLTAVLSLALGIGANPRDLHASPRNSLEAPSGEGTASGLPRHEKQSGRRIRLVV